MIQIVYSVSSLFVDKIIQHTNLSNAKEHPESIHAASNYSPSVLSVCLSTVQ